jgi:hypothetical protein
MSIAAIVANVIATARARAFHPRARIGCLLRSSSDGACECNYLLVF